jgi:hypothetical protein
VIFALAVDASKSCNACIFTHSENFVGVAGALGEIRTPDPQIRSLMLYPAELRARQTHLSASSGKKHVFDPKNAAQRYGK